MILKALEMQGFKSFADKTVFEFEKGITAVVGPNGSGKSNISDAVMWVLGETRTKNLRGSKMEDVIFSGTEARRGMGYAQVTLRLDNTDRSIKKYDMDEVTVTRKYYRSGQGEYSINGESARLHDIQEMFMDTGLGRNGYSMVGQGKIGSLISSKGSERREMFEEAAGISHYRSSRNDSLKKLDQAEENMIRLRDILSELEGRVGPLKIQKEKAEKFLILADEKRELEIGLWLHTIEKTKNEIKKQEDKIALATNQYQQTERELTEIETKIEEAISAAQKITEEIENIRLSKSEAEEKAMALDSRADIVENTIEHNKQTIERILRDKNDNADIKTSFENEIRENERKIEQLKELSLKKQAELLDLAQQIEDAKKKGAELSDESAVITGEIASLTKTLADNTVTSQTAHSSIDEINSRIGTIDDLIADREKDTDSLRVETESVEKELKKTNDEITSLSNAVQGYEMRVSSRSKKADEMKREIDDKAFDIQKKESRAKMLEDLEKNMEGYSGAVKAVMREKSRGTLGGIHGAVSQLITVENKYATAVEVAFGAAIQNIVTTNENDAKRAIEFLKKSNSGRATFLPMTAIEPKSLQENGLDDCYGFVDIAVNLLTYDKAYDNIIRNLLGRTVVAEDMDCAIAIGKKYRNRFKIVTLDGQVINAGGSMTGGSRAMNAGILSRGTQIDDLRKDCENKKKKLELLKDTYKALSEDLSTCRAELDGANADLLRAQENKIRIEGDLRLCRSQLETSESALAELESEKNNSGERIKALNEIAGKADKIIGELNKKISEKEARLDEIGTIKGESEELREQINTQATEINLSIHSAEKDIENLHSANEDLGRRIESQSEKTTQLDEEIEGINNEIKDLTAQALELRKEAAQVRQDSRSADDEIKNLQSRRTEEEGASSRLRVLERNKTTERENVSGELARLEERKIVMLREYDDTVNKLYDEYQLTRREAEQLNIVIEEPVKSQKRLNEIRSQIRSLGSVNVGAIEEYKEVSERYEFMNGQIQDIEKSRKELIKIIEDLTQKMGDRFADQFAKIKAEFSKTFVELFGGGSADIYLENPGDVLESSIIIKVQPPGKNVLNIDQYSGGEKALSAVALLLAIFKVNPAPFCFLDEVEAALDEVNVLKYAQYLRRMTDSTQFVLITHRRGSMEEADVLYGVTMQEKGISKILELKTAEMAKQLGIS